MKYSEAKVGRVFVVRLEDGDILHESIEALAKSENVSHASVTLLGAADKGSKLVVGPKEERPNDGVVPMEYELKGAYEMTGTGTIIPNATGAPILHMHIAGARGEDTKGGCVRRGVKVWHVMEAVVTELVGLSSKRLMEEDSGFELLRP